MTLWETIEKEHCSYMENITVKCGNKILYDGKILDLLNNNLPLLNMTTKDILLITGKGYEIEVVNEII